MLTLIGLSSVLFAVPVEHKVIFLLDVSQSMCDHLENDAKVDELKNTAKQMLNDSINISGMKVSFFKFGEMTHQNGTFVPHIRQDKKDISPSEALEYVDTFFQYTQDKTHCSHHIFPDPWTYVASSVRYVLTDVLELPSSRCDTRWSKYNDEKNPVPQVTILGITDQGDDGKGKGESTPCGTDKTPTSSNKHCHGDYKKYHDTNIANIEWMKNESGLLENFNYQFWNIDQKNKSPLSIDRSSVFYRVKWSGPYDLKVNPVNLLDAAAKIEWEVDGRDLPKIHLYPLLLNPQDDAKEVLQKEGALFMGEPTEIAPSSKSKRDVTLIPIFDHEDNRELSRNLLAGLQFEAPARNVHGKSIEISEIEIPFVGKTTVRYESTNTGDRLFLRAGPNSKHLLRLNVTDFAEHLSQQYPNSSFIWATKPYDSHSCEDLHSINLDTDLPALARLPAERKELPSDFTFTWKGTDEDITSKFTIGFDRLWNASWIHPTNPEIKESNHVRETSWSAKKFENRNTKAAKEILREDFSVEYSATAKDAAGNEIPVGDIMDMNALQESGRIIIPPKEQVSFSLGCLGFCYGYNFPEVNNPTIDGPIVVSITATPKLKSTGLSNRVRVDIEAEGNSNESYDKNTVSFEVHIQKAPMHYVRIAQITVATLIAFWFWIGWLRRPRFIDAVYLGLDSTLIFRNKMETVGGIVETWKYSTFGRLLSLKHPCYYLQLDPNFDDTVGWNAAAAPATTNEGFILGIAPHRNKKSLYVWCASCDPEWNMILKGSGLFTRLTPIQSSDLFHKRKKKRGELDLNSGIEKININDLEGLAIHLTTSQREEPTVFQFKQFNKETK